MAILPSSFGTGESNTLKTLCIDYLRDSPAEGDFYNDILSFDKADKQWKKKIGSSYQIEGFNGVGEMKLKDRQGNEIAPATIKQTLITGQQSEKIPRRYLQFINSKIESYRKELELSKEPFDEYVQSELQSEIWEYNVLDNLGYLKNEGKIEDDLVSGLQKFNDDWGNGFDLFNKRTLSVAGELKYIHKLNETEGEAFMAFSITKNSNNEYLVFDGPSKFVFKGKDETELLNFLGTKLNQNDNVYFLMSNFESLEKQKAFLSTVRMQLKGKEKNITVNNFPIEKSDILFSPEFKHKLSKPISNEVIETIKLNEKYYFKKEFQISSEGESYNYFGEKNQVTDETEFEALSTSKTVIELFASKANSLFTDFSNNISLARFFNNFKKDIKATMKIQSEDEFIIHIKNEFKDIRIVKLFGDYNIYYRMN
jgi:hypothetical protein